MRIFIQTLESRYRRLIVEAKCRECGARFKVKGQNIHLYRRGTEKECYFVLEEPAVICYGCGEIIPIRRGIDKDLKQYIINKPPVYIQ